jgi:hypothetical protein
MRDSMNIPLQVVTTSLPTIDHTIPFSTLRHQKRKADEMSGPEHR